MRERRGSREHKYGRSESAGVCKINANASILVNGSEQARNCSEGTINLSQSLKTPKRSLIKGVKTRGFRETPRKKPFANPFRALKYPGQGTGHEGKAVRHWEENGFQNK